MQKYIETVATFDHEEIRTVLSVVAKFDPTKTTLSITQDPNTFRFMAKIVEVSAAEQTNK